MLYLRKNENLGFSFFKKILKPINHLFSISLATMCQALCSAVTRQKGVKTVYPCESSLDEYFGNRQYVVEEYRFEKL